MKQAGGPLLPPSATTRMLKYNTPCDTVTLKLQNKDNIVNQFAGGWGKLSKVNRAIKWEK